MKPKRNIGVIVGVVLVVLLAAGLVVFRDRFRGSREKITPKGIATGLPAKKVVAQAMTVPTETSELAFRLDVNKAKDVRAAIDANAWLQDVLGSSLGRGLSSGWSAFLSSRGEDLNASFKGTIGGYLLDKALAEPFSFAWFGGDTASGTPAIILDKSASSVFEAMNAIAERGGYTATHCPGEDAPPPKKDKDGKDIPPEAKIKISRWLVADHAVYAGVNGDRVVFSAKATPVLQGLCVKLGEHKRSPAALELSVYPERIGREAQALGALIGLGSELRFAVDLEQGKWMPKGVSGGLLASDRLAVSAPSDDLLKLLPADVPVVAVMALSLPEKLDAASIAAHMKGEDKGKRLDREVALVWTPHGDGEATDIALIWGRSEDEKALNAIFDGTNTLVKKKACSHLLLASTQGAADRLENACKGKTPSRQNADPAVVSGAKAQASVGLHLALGRLFSGLLVEAYKEELPAGKKTGALPPEIEQAKSKLEALPFFGFRGRVQDNALVPEGFRS